MRILFVVLLCMALCMLSKADVKLDKLRLLPGWKVQLVTDQVPKCRKMAISKDATYLFLGSSTDKVYAVPLSYNIGQNTVTQSGPVKFIAQGQVYPHGVVYDDTNEDLYFSANYSSIYKLADIVKNVNNPPSPTLVTDRLPGTSMNGVKTLRFDNDQQRIYFAQGVNCDSCLVNYTISPPSYYGMIMSIDKNNPNDFRIHATGVRNSVGFIFHPNNPKELWFADTSNKEFSEEVNVIPDVTQNYNTDTVPNYGYPYCHGHNDPDTHYYNGSCTQYVSSKYELQERITVLGIEFNMGSGLPPKSILFAEKGSVGREGGENGYRVTYVDTDNPVDNYKVFADGWLEGKTESTSWGRPVDVKRLAIDNSVLVSDEKAGAVYRFYYTGSDASASVFASITTVAITLILLMVFM